MKTEINLTNRANFYHLYQGSHVCFEGISNSVWYCVPNLVFGSSVHLGDKGLTRINDCPPLVLKPLSSITDEDAYYVGASVNCWSWAERKQKFFKDDEMSKTHIGFGEMFASAIGKEYGHGMSHPFAHNSTDILHGFDYLRSKGYALPWMGLTVEEMIQAGWIKLRENTV